MNGQIVHKALLDAAESILDDSGIQIDDARGIVSWPYPSVVPHGPRPIAPERLIALARSVKSSRTMRSAESASLATTMLLRGVAESARVLQQNIGRQTGPMWSRLDRAMADLDRSTDRAKKEWEMPVNERACAVNERTGNGVSVGRCWFNVVDGRCPRHGDVTEVQTKYAKTGKLTDEADLYEARGERPPWWGISAR